MQRTLIDAAFAPGPIGAGEARRRLEAVERELPEGAYSKIRLLVSELVADAGWHPSAPAVESLALKVDHHDSFVRVRVTDAGRRRDADTDETDTNRWQTFLLDQMSDRWGILEDASTDVWFEVDTEA